MRIFSPKKILMGTRQRTVSGSDVAGFSVPCEGEDCPHIELDDLENSGRNIRGKFEGRSWISGKYQRVSGGWGCLKSVNKGKEPTGRLPYGNAFKVVVMEPSETTDTVLSLCKSITNKHNAIIIARASILFGVLRKTLSAKKRGSLRKPNPLSQDC